MFEIAKIINSSAPSVEPEVYPITEGTKIAYGCALVMNGGKLGACKTGQIPEYICASDEADEFGEITVYPVEERIEFRVRLKNGNASDCSRLDRVSVLSEDGIAVSVQPDAQGGAIITRIPDETGHVYIKFKV